MHYLWSESLDPVSQGVLGVVAAQSAAKRGQIALATLCGAAAGMAADLDVLIRSENDPLLYLEFHRQFSHALVFIPFGGLLVAALLHVVTRSRLRFMQSWLFCTVGYATHGLLDACTSYGTQLLWPFSNARIAWHTVSIIDPLFTLPLLGCAGIAYFRGHAGWAKTGLVWVSLFMAAGMVQRERAEAALELIADSRNHQPQQASAKPSFGNLLVWKLTYEHEGRYYVDAVRLGARALVYPGTSIAALDIQRDLPWLPADSEQARDLERFRWFSNNHLALAPSKPGLVFDLRYSLVPNQADGMWGIELSADRAPDEHAEFVQTRDITGAERTRFLQMLRGEKLTPDVVED